MRPGTYSMLGRVQLPTLYSQDWLGGAWFDRWGGQIDGIDYYSLTNPKIGQPLLALQVGQHIDDPETSVISWAPEAKPRPIYVHFAGPAYQKKNFKLMTDESDLQCMAHDTEGYAVWWGTSKGVLRAAPLKHIDPNWPSSSAGTSSCQQQQQQQGWHSWWSGKNPAVEVKVSEAAITALAVGRSCCWVGTAYGEVWRVDRHKATQFEVSGEFPDEPAMEKLPTPLNGCLNGAPVLHIVEGGGRLYAAAGSTKDFASLQVWDINSLQVLGTVDISGCMACNMSPVTCMTLLDPSVVNLSAGESSTTPSQGSTTTAPYTAAGEDVAMSMQDPLSRDSSLSPFAATDLYLPPCTASYDSTSSSPAVDGLSGVSCSSGSSSHADHRLITGHADGKVLFWEVVGSDPSEQSLAPTLLLASHSAVEPGSFETFIQKSPAAVVSVDIISHAGLLLCGYRTGRVSVHMLEPAALARPSLEIFKWTARSLMRPLHDSSALYGLLHMKVIGKLVVTGGQSGRSKVWSPDVNKLLQELLSCPPSILTGIGLISVRRPSFGMMHPSLQQPSVPQPSVPQLSVPQTPNVPSTTQAPGLVHRDQDTNKPSIGSLVRSLTETLSDSLTRAYSRQDSLRQDSLTTTLADLANIPGKELLMPRPTPGRRQGLSDTLGTGSFGTVVLREYKGNLVAVKCIKARTVLGFTDSCRAASEEKLKEELRTEVNFLKQAKHDRIVKLIGVCKEEPPIEQSLGIVMEFCEGGSLWDCLLKARSNPGVAERLDVLGIADNIAEGMEFLHSHNILHRDIKSLNLFLMRDNTIKVGDLGLGRFLDPNQTHVDTITTGTIRWLAPEMISWSPTGCEVRPTPLVSRKSDVYAFGIVLWEMLTAQLPFEHVPPPEHGGRGQNFLHEGLIGDAILRGDRPRLPAEREQLMELPGARLLKPVTVLEGYLDLMRWCWDQERDNRPTFEQVRQKLAELLQHRRQMQHQQQAANLAAAS